MSFFRYEAIDRTGKVVMGTMDAPSEAEVNARLTQMGYRPQTVMPAPKSFGAAPSSNRTLNTQRSTRTPPAEGGQATPGELALFFRQFASLVRAGITLYQALDNLAPRAGNPDLMQAAREMARAAHGGGPISDVMAKYPCLFAPHVVASVRAGELGGFLEIVLEEIAYDYEQEVAFYKGMWLPKALILQAPFALAITQPLFPTLFPAGDFPGYLKLVLLRNIPIVLALLLLGRFLYRRFQEPRYRERRDELALRLPVFGDLARQRSLASFVRMLRRLLAAGIGPIQAWEGAMNVAPNAVIRAKLVDACGLMRQNVPFHEAFTNTGLFANETEQLLATGVLSGQMVEMMDRVAEYYQNNVQRAFDNARFWMYRLGISLFIALSGVILIVMAYTYFNSLFSWVDQMFES